MQLLDLAARKAEVQNLPEAHVQQLINEFGLGPGRKNLMAKVMADSNKLLAHDGRQANFYDVLDVAVQDTSEYSTLMRVFGLYPLAAIPVAIVTLRVNDEIAEWHRLPEDERPALGVLTAYGPADGIEFSDSEVRQIIERSRQNPLGIPLPSADDQNKLLAMFAPLIFQEEVADYDKLGAVVWDDQKVSVDIQRPLMYVYFSHAYLSKVPILQINYVIWYSERSGANSPRIERGNLDGLAMRVSLDEQGRPFMVDVMNNCGCYHFYAPRKQKVERILPSPMAIDAFVPTWLPDEYPRQRLAIRVMSGWHQVVHLGSSRIPSDYRPYQFIRYDHLEKLPTADARSESIFNSSGIAKNTERVESDIFIPMGVPQVGRMRQRGHHAVKFVGRAHFDDPHLFDKHFEFR
jgi:hypothetical protein